MIESAGAYGEGTLGKGVPKTRIITESGFDTRYQDHDAAHPVG